MYWMWSIPFSTDLVGSAFKPVHVQCVSVQRKSGAGLQTRCTGLSVQRKRENPEPKSEKYTRTYARVHGLWIFSPPVGEHWRIKQRPKTNNFELANIYRVLAKCHPSPHLLWQCSHGSYLLTLLEAVTQLRPCRFKKSWKYLLYEHLTSVPLQYSPPGEEHCGRK